MDRKRFIIIVIITKKHASPPPKNNKNLPTTLFSLKEECFTPIISSLGKRLCFLQSAENVKKAKHNQISQKPAYEIHLNQTKSGVDIYWQCKLQFVMSSACKTQHDCSKLRRLVEYLILSHLS